MNHDALPSPPGSEPEWGAELLDLDAYLARIGYEGPRTATVETLRGLHRAHLAAISFENVTIALGEPLDIGVEAIQEKIVGAGHGGYCYENNLLFAAALERLGFPVSRLLARVRRGVAPIRWRSHTVLLVEAGGEVWLADVGFGDEGPLEPVRFQAGAQLEVGAWSWRLDQEGPDWILRSLHADGWFDVYALRLERQHPVDFQVANYYSSTNPRSPFVNNLVAQRPEDQVRYSLVNRVLSTQFPDGRKDVAELSGDEVVRTLRDTFLVTLSDDEAKLLRDRP
ncbi:arylamine N-acetyltransferase family protein [Streptomyces sp. NBC_01244]|uniref:arylamine N-acetyltransferase family protein n=1 Tax=Streptomyces sp. NBC_01244 TaxID=2903797 RepID=UPI002E0D0FC5|nr:arylamine N-acetyltransferase [Streptomyces sp. NBC_01244]